MRRDRAILCVDVGNSFTKFFRVNHNRIVRVAEYATLAVLTQPQRAVTHALRRAGGVEDAIVASVVPAVTQLLSRALREGVGGAPLVVRHDLRFPFRVGVGNPRELGVDRLAVAAGALAPRARSVIVVDVGSAITVDLVDNRVYRGGYIMAGPGLSLTALGDHTSRLPRLKLGSPRRVRVPFRSTAESMMAGATVAAVGAIEAAVKHHRGQAGRPVTTVITGGGARALRRRLPAAWRYTAEAIALGLHRTYLLNRP